MAGNAIKVREYGLEVIYRHDYDKSQNGDNIKAYITKSCEALSKFLNNVPQASSYESFLDIGCGGSQALDYFDGRLKCAGIDLYPQVQDDRIIQGNFYDLKSALPKEKYDVLFVNHTLEHALAPLLLEQIREIHSIGGVLFVAVPDADYPWAYDITSSTTHWSIFNEGFLRVLLQRYGYEVCIEKKCFREGCGELFAYAIRRW